MARHHIPTLICRTFTPTMQEEVSIPCRKVANILLKGGRASNGKGVLIIDQLARHSRNWKQCWAESLAPPVTAWWWEEEYLSGVECSVFVLTDGKSYQLLPTAKDYKRSRRGRRWPRAAQGGMGAVSPVPFADTHLYAKGWEGRIIAPTVRGGWRRRVSITVGLYSSRPYELPKRPYMVSRVQLPYGRPPENRSSDATDDDLVPSTHGSA